MGAGLVGRISIELRLRLEASFGLPYVQHLRRSSLMRWDSELPSRQNRPQTDIKDTGNDYGICAPCRWRFEPVDFKSHASKSNCLRRMTGKAII